MLLIKKKTPPGLVVLLIKQINEVFSKQINLIANLKKTKNPPDLIGIKV